MPELAVRIIGWTLLHSLWQGALVALAAALTLALLPRASARHRYAVLVVAFAANLAAPLATALVLATRHRPEATSSATRRVSDALPDALPYARPGGRAVSTGGATTGLATLRSATVGDRAVAWIDAHADTLLASAVGLWLVGVAVGGARLLGAWLVLRRIVARATPAAQPLVERVHRLAARVGARRSIRVLVSADRVGPFTSGVLRPLIVLPLAMLTGLDPLSVDTILAHELAHVRRWDYAVALLQGVALTLLFHHPATWWLDRRLRIEREYCCDDEAVAASRSPVRYARALAELESLRAGLPSLALAATSGSLLDRIERLVGTRRAPAAPGWIPVLAVVVLLGAAGVVRAAEAPRHAPSAAPAPPFGARKDALSAVPELLRSGDFARAATHAAMGTVARVVEGVSPPPPESLDERWRRAVADAGRGEVVIGWRIASAANAGDAVVSSTDGSSWRGGSTVAWLVGAVADPTRDDPSRRAPTPGVALLFGWSGARGEITSVRLRSMDARLDLGARALTWFGDVPDSASIAQIQSLMATTRDVGLRRELGAALTLHDDRPRLTRAVARVLDTDSAPVRAETLAWIGRPARDSASAALLRRGLDDPSPEVRDEAITALAGDRASHALMLDLLRRSPYADVRQEIAQRLSSGDAATVAALLRAAFDDANGDVRSEAVDSIKETSGHAARAALGEIAARHPEARLRGEARDALDEGRRWRE